MIMPFNDNIRIIFVNFRLYIFFKIYNFFIQFFFGLLF